MCDSARPIGLLQMIDQGEKDDKIIAVHADDPEFNVGLHTYTTFGFDNMSLIWSCWLLVAYS
jgi:hypothetical protein